jgi:hypothetical protein
VDASVNINATGAWWLCIGAQGRVLTQITVVKHKFMESYKESGGFIHSTSDFEIYLPWKEIQTS